MNAIELFHQDGKSAHVFYCGKCRLVRASADAANDCCSPRKCACGVTLEGAHVQCPGCWEKQMDSHEAERYRKAEKRATWDGPVFSEGHGYQDGYFNNLEEFISWLEEDWPGDETDPSPSPPSYAWACNEVPVCQLDIDSILENATQEAYDGFSVDDLVGREKLAAALDEFNAANQKTVNWEIDYRIAVTFVAPIVAEVPCK